MNSPVSTLPEDLNALLTELGISPTDPKFKLLVRFLKDFSEIKDLLESARPSIAAVLDNRLERMKQWADLLASVDKRLNEVLDHFETKPLKIREQVEEELAEPMKGLIESYAKLDQQAKGLLQRIEGKNASITTALYVALLALGFMGGLLTLCLGHFLGWL